VVPVAVAGSEKNYAVKVAVKRHSRNLQ